MAQPIQIDGSRGEGGGQILRTALTLSAWLGLPFEMVRIRANRPRPGLKAQHLAAVQGVAAICGAEVEGAQRGAEQLTFYPGDVRAGSYRWEVGTAGATALVAQATALPLMRAAGNSRLRIGGGSHVAWSPPLDHLRDVYAPLLRLFGFDLKARLVRYGFYPRGGGEILIEVKGRGDATEQRNHPRQILRLERPERSRIRIDATAVISSLPRGIAERMLGVVRQRLEGHGWPVVDRIVEARGPQGTFVFIRVHGGEEPHDPGRHSEASEAGEGGLDPEKPLPLIAGGFIGLGERGKPAERVAGGAVDEALEFLESDACIDPRLADQLLLPAALAGGALTFKTSRLTGHLGTNAETIALFVGPCVLMDPDGRVTIQPPASAMQI